MGKAEIAKVHLWGVRKSTPLYSYCSLARTGEKPDQALHLRVPTNDTKTTTLWIRFYPQDPPGLQIKGMAKREAGIYKRVDDGWGWD